MDLSSVFFAVVIVLCQNAIQIDAMKVDIEDCNFGPHDESWVTNLQAHCGSLNQTAKGLNLNFTLKRDLKDSTNVGIQFLIRFGSHFNPTPLKFQLSMQEVLALKSFDLPSLFLNHCSPKLLHPLHKGKYKMTNYITDGNNYPKIPPGFYKIHMEFKDGKKVFAIYNHFISAEN